MRVNIEREVAVTCLHRNPVLVKAGPGAWSELHEGETVTLNNLDEIKFLPDAFHFQVKLSDVGQSSPPSPSPPSHSSQSDLVVTPKPTGLKKRKLPSWLSESECAKKRKTPLKDNPSSSYETNEGNVELENSSVRVEKMQEPEKPTGDLDVPGHSTIHSINEDDNEEVVEEDGEADKENRREVPRPSCSYGASCYRKNPVHRREEAHPGDDDYEEHPAVDLEENEEDKPECEYGLECYRKNPQHRRDYKHTRKAQPQRKAKVKKGGKKKKTEDDYDSDDSFIDDEEDGWEPVDDSDDDADYKAPANLSSELEYDEPDDLSGSEQE